MLVKVYLYSHDMKKIVAFLLPTEVSTDYKAHYIVKKHATSQKAALLVKKRSTIMFRGLFLGWKNYRLILQESLQSLTTLLRASTQLRTVKSITSYTKTQHRSAIELHNASQKNKLQSWCSTSFVEAVPQTAPLHPKFHLKAAVAQKKGLTIAVINYLSLLLSQHRRQRSHLLTAFPFFPLVRCITV